MATMTENEKELRKILRRRLSDPILDKDVEKKGSIDFMKDTPARIEQLLWDRENNKAYHTLQEVPLLKVAYFDFGMGYMHNMPCAVSPGESAIHDGNTGVFLPSGKAQSEGWKLIRIKTKFQAWLYKKFFGRVK